LTALPDGLHFPNFYRISTLQQKCLAETVFIGNKQGILQLDKNVNKILTNLVHYCFQTSQRGAHFVQMMIIVPIMYLHKGGQKCAPEKRARKSARG
jgi:hypothetical protein